MPNVLLTTVCRPFGGPGEGSSVGAELFHMQITRAQGLFSMRQVTRCWALDYIAENIEAPCVSLHYPSEKELIAELKRGSYDFLGINFVIATFHKARRITELVRKHSPNTKIVYGGYGTVLPDDQLKPYADFVCREEGSGFMRRVLGEPPSTEIKHPFAPIPSSRIYSYQRLDKLVGHITSGLGCPNACDFCCTSHFFKRKFVPYIDTGQRLYDVLRSQEKMAEARGKRLTSFILIDEDFFTQKRRAQEFLEAVRKNGPTLPLTGFGSVRGISNFTADEIAEMGFEAVWIGFEGKKSGYSKLVGRPLEQIYEEFRQRGVLVIASMIVGYPYHTREVVMEEFDELCRLGPAMTQILHYAAIPGTELHRTAVQGNWFREEFRVNPDLRLWDGFTMQFHHSHFSRPEIEQLQRDLFRWEFERLGPTILRILRIRFEGYKNLRDSPNPILKANALHKWEEVAEALPGILPGVYFGPSKEARAEAKALYDDIAREKGGVKLSERIVGWACIGLAAFTAVLKKLEIFQQPALLRVEHRVVPATKEVPAHRIQGGLYANPFKALWEDLGWAFTRLYRRWFPKLRDREALSPPVNTMNQRAEFVEMTSQSVGPEETTPAESAAALQH